MVGLAKNIATQPSIAGNWAEPDNIWSSCMEARTMFSVLSMCDIIVCIQGSERITQDLSLI